MVIISPSISKCHAVYLKHTVLYILKNYQLYLNKAEEKKMTTNVVNIELHRNQCSGPGIAEPGGSGDRHSSFLTAWGFPEIITTRNGH